MLAIACTSLFVWTVGTNLCWWSMFADAPLAIAISDAFLKVVNSRYFFWAVVFIVCVPVVLIYFVGLRRQTAAWKALAAQTGLVFVHGSWLLPDRGRISGRYRGRDVELYTYTPIISDDPTRVMCLTLQVRNPTGGTLRLDRSSAGRVIGDFFQARAQFQSGIAAFDRAFTVQSKPSEFARSILHNPLLCQHLSYLREGSTVEVQECQLLLERLGRESDITYLHFCLDVLSELADVLEC
ncbi:MAG: hypothetical protein JXA33_19015 [Anaerolineae bacterium]|nr:hypothetical protein [Anaerolineae bacterium]